jgi:succinate-semialdehyde dehydrogenase
MTSAPPILQDNIPAAVSRNPATGEILARYPFQSHVEVEALLTAADGAYRRWRTRPVDERARVIAKLASLAHLATSAFASFAVLPISRVMIDAKASVSVSSTSASLAITRARSSTGRVRQRR